MLAAAGCQATPASPSGEGSSTAASQSGEQSASSVAASSETVTSQEESSSASSEPSTSVSSTASSSSTASIGEQTSSNSQDTSSYSFSSKVADDIDAADYTDTITVVLTPEASNANKTYTANDFTGCDITILEQGFFGGNVVIVDSDSQNQNTSPTYVYLRLKINQSGFDNYQRVIQYFDQREDVYEIWLVPHAIPD